MSTEHGFQVLIVGRSDDLGRALSEVSALLGDGAFPRRSGARAPLIGVWLDPVLAQHPPTTIGRAPARDRARFKIYESVSMGGIWTLCAVSPLSARPRSDDCALRESLIAGLMRERAAHARAVETPMFAPVFNERASPEEMSACVRRLRRAFPGRIGDEIIWCGDLGADAAKGRRCQDHRVDAGKVAS
jgi:hypothetical protein